MFNVPVIVQVPDADALMTRFAQISIEEAHTEGIQRELYRVAGQDLESEGVVAAFVMALRLHGRRCQTHGGSRVSPEQFERYLEVIAGDAIDRIRGQVLAIARKVETARRAGQAPELEAPVPVIDDEIAAGVLISTDPSDEECRQVLEEEFGITEEEAERIVLEADD